MISSREGLKSFGRQKVNFMLELIELGRKDKVFGKTRCDDLLRFKQFLMNYRRMVWGDPIELPSDWKRDGV